MNKIFIVFLSLVLVTGFLFLAPVARAMTPTLSLSTASQTGDYVQVNVNGDPEHRFFLWWDQIMVVWGIFLQAEPAHLPLALQLRKIKVFLVVRFEYCYKPAVYVKTGGINGTCPTKLHGHMLKFYNNGKFTLSQSAFLLNAGQTSTITASANYLYLLSNSSPSIANINFNANK